MPWCVFYLKKPQQPYFMNFLPLLSNVSSFSLHGAAPPPPSLSSICSSRMSLHCSPQTVLAKGLGNSYAAKSHGHFSPFLSLDILAASATVHEVSGKIFFGDFSIIPHFVGFYFVAIYYFLKLYQGIIHIPGFTLVLGFQFDGFEKHINSCNLYQGYIHYSKNSIMILYCHSVPISPSPWQPLIRFLSMVLPFPECLNENIHE